MSTINPNKLKPNGVYHCQGGIERYVKTYPKGGYFKGKNYLFDKRMEQIPGGSAGDESTTTGLTTESMGDNTNNNNNNKVEEGNAKEEDTTTTTNIDAKCCLCRCSYTQYRGQYKCNRSLCGVPVIVCDTCRLKTNAINPDNLICELCREGHRIVTPKNFDLIAQKRKAEEIYQANCDLKGEEEDDDEAGGKKFKKPKQDQKLQQEEQDPTEEPLSKTTTKKKKDTLKTYHTDRLFLRRLPLTVTFSKIRRALFVAGNDYGSGMDNSNNPSDNNNNNKNNKAMSTQIVGCRWLVDKKYNAFYGSCIIQLSNEHIAKQILKRSKTSKPSGGANGGGGIKIDKKKIKVELEFKKDPNHNVVCVAEQGGVVKEEEIFGQDEYPPLGKVREN